MKHSVFLLGSTGSIGVNTLAVMADLNRRFAKKGKPAYRAVGLAAGRESARLGEQVAAWKPKVAYIQDPAGYTRLKKQFPGTRWFTGDDGLVDALRSVRYDICVNALVGSAGLIPTLTALEEGADIALANKETLIMGGHLVQKSVKKHGAQLVPIDSEHSAIFHLLKGFRKKEIARLVLTASGGPFWNREIDNPTVEETLNHPTWKMGRKITIDSATMMNKGFEVVEAHFLFGVPYDRIDTVIHPRSLIHSMVETIDGEIYAQLGPNDMRHPIQNALTHPHLLETSLPRLGLERLGQLSFHPMDLKKFPMLDLAYACGRKGGSALTALNAANEAAVGLFLEGRLSYRDIYTRVAKAVDNHPYDPKPRLETVLTLDREIKAAFV